MSTYFISDIHLDGSTTSNAQLLLNFLNTTGQSAAAIYILGDLFAIWFGDDLNPEYADKLVRALKALTDKNIPIYFMRGNRDFLVGSKFCAASGCTLLDDPCVIDLYGEKVLLTHGDMLCTDDKRYQKFRKVVQSKFAKQIFLSLPKWLRVKIGSWVKNKAMRNGKANIQDPNFNISAYDTVPTTVEAWMSNHNVRLVIHGHTHKPAIHKIATGARVVLGDWNEQSAQIMVHDGTGYRLQDLLIYKPI